MRMLVTFHVWGVTGAERETELGTVFSILVKRLLQVRPKFWERSRIVALPSEMKRRRSERAATLGEVTSGPPLPLVPSRYSSMPAGSSPAGVESKPIPPLRLFLSAKVYITK